MTDTRTTLRPYQRRIVSEILNGYGNGLVVLPTGAGKTLIASALLIHKHSDPAVLIRPCVALFLVPTCILVEQQAKGIEYETSLRVARYSSQLSLPRPGSFDVLVCTPAAFTQLETGPHECFHIESFSTIIFDEVHHVVKRHPYRDIARILKGLREQKRPQVVGLTASLTYAVEAGKIRNSIKNLCAELAIHIIASATHEELVQDGYHGKAGSEVKVVEQAVTAPDEVCYETHSWVNTTTHLFKAHELREEFLCHIDLYLAHPLSDALYTCVGYFEDLIAGVDKTFVSPMKLKGKAGKITEWGAYAHQRFVRNGQMPSKLRHAYEQLEHLYEAVRIAMISRQEDIELSFLFLIMMGVSVEGQYDELVFALESLMDAYSQHCEKYGPNIRLSNLVKQLKVQSKSFGDAFRCIIFVQQRVVAHVVQWYIGQDADLRGCMRVDSGVVYATSTPATASLRLTNSGSKRCMEKFRTGELNILVSTSVSEEGMDIPAANCVIRFDVIQTPVSVVQSRGRARQEDSNFVVLAESTQANRAVAHLQEAEHHQYNILSTKPSVRVRETTRTSQKRPMRPTEASSNRRKKAKLILEDRYYLFFDTRAYIELLNNYVAHCEGKIVQSMQKAKGQWMCTLVMRVPDEQKRSATACGDTKQVAKTQAAQKLVESILL